MSCNLTTSLALGCRDSVGGIKRILVTELANKATLMKTGELIDVFTLNTGKQFWEYQLEPETSNYTDADTGDRAAGTLFSVQTLEAVFNKFDLAKRNELRLLAKNRVMVMVEDRNGVYVLLGEKNGLTVATNNRESGTAMGDSNRFTVTLSGNEEEPSTEVASALIPVLIAPAV